jgi:hypothetical protein
MSKSFEFDFDSVINNTACEKLFVSYLTKHNKNDLIDFYYAYNKYRFICHQKLQETALITEAKKIFDTFIEQGAPSELPHISSSTRDYICAVVNGKTSGTLESIFDDIYTNVHTLLRKEVFCSFVRSRRWTSFIKSQDAKFLAHIGGTLSSEYQYPTLTSHFFSKPVITAADIEASETIMRDHSHWESVYKDMSKGEYMYASNKNFLSDDVIKQYGALGSCRMLYTVDLPANTAVKLVLSGEHLSSMYALPECTFVQYIDANPQQKDSYSCAIIKADVRKPMPKEFLLTVTAVYDKLRRCYTIIWKSCELEQVPSLVAYPRGCLLMCERFFELSETQCKREIMAIGSYGGWIYLQQQHGAVGNMMQKFMLKSAGKANIKQAQQFVTEYSKASNKTLTDKYKIYQTLMDYTSLKNM